MSQYHRVIISGPSVAGEVWSVGLNYNGAPLMNEFEALTEWAEGIRAFILAAPVAGIYQILSDQAAISKVRCELRDHDESLMAAGEAPFTSAKFGSGTASKVPQTAVCFSLLTARPGRSYRGRIYWPAFSWTGTAAMRFSGANLATWLANLNALNVAIISAAEAVDPEVSIALGVRSKLLHTTAEVTRYAAGDVPDVQRRRRDALIEAYTALDVT